MKTKLISCGALFIFNNKILLCHSTNSAWKGIRATFIPPKGTLEENESQEDCIVREIKEELNITLPKSKLKNCKVIRILGNRDNYIYVVHLKSLSEIGLTSEVVPKIQLQLNEVDHAKFYSKNEASELLNNNWKILLNELK